MDTVGGQNQKQKRSHQCSEAWLPRKGDPLLETVALRTAAKFCTCHLNSTAGVFAKDLKSEVYSNGTRYEGHFVQNCARQV